MPEPNTITSRLPQAPPRGTPGASAIVWMDPSTVSIRFILPSAKNPSQRLSGDQNGSSAFAVPGNGRAVNESIRRTQSCVRSGRSVATNASCVPSGDSDPPLVPSACPNPLLEPK